jgi:uncharacterized circularly permuted ATP-grasp superfamily protein
MVADTGMPRAPSAALYDCLQALSAEDFAGRCAARDRAFLDQGITFSFSGEERPFPLDLVPRVISAVEWSVVERGVAQRVRALEAFLDDIYGSGEILSDGLVPRKLVVTSKHFHRAAAGIRSPNGVRVHVAGIDLARGPDGRFCVLEDNVRTPSGISYVIENRRTMARVMPSLFASHRVRPVDGYPARLLEALRASAPEGVVEPTVVVLTPGVHNSAYFEHSFLARQMGVQLVHGSDLVCRGNTVFMRSTSGEQRVDVVYRRVDDEFLDPVQFRWDSLVGCPGLLNSARAGTVTIANAVGNGVADDKLVYTYVPAMISYYLGEEPILPNVPTYRLSEPDQLEHALGRLEHLVLKPVDGSGGKGLVFGNQASDEQLDAVTQAVYADPRAWIAQELVQLSTSPTQVGDRLCPRHVDLRPFALHDGKDVWVVPGGLTRVALEEGSLVVNSSRGGGSKDTWVLSTRAGSEARIRSSDRAGNRPGLQFGLPPDLGPEAIEPAEQHQQQQQQQARAGGPSGC